MSKKRLLIALLTFLSLMTIPFAVQATTITACTFDKDTYHQGETGYIRVTLYNEKENKIRVTELSATINYYYTDETVHIEKFYTNATLPLEIQQGNSSTLYIPFDLPNNIASGYTEVHVKAVTQLWNPSGEIWFTPEQLTEQPILFIESPYKEQLEEQQTINEQLEDQLDEQQTANEQLEEQLEEQQTINRNTTNMMYLFGATAIVFAAVTVFLFILNRRARVFTQPIA